MVCPIIIERMSVSTTTLRLLESLYRGGNIAALLQAGVEHGCWAAARWRSEVGEVESEVGVSDSDFQRHAFSLGWLEAAPQLEPELAEALAPSLEAWLEAQRALRAARTTGCWVDRESGRFLSVLPSVVEVLGLTAAEFLALPVPSDWLDALASASAGGATFYMENGSGRPCWLQARWTPGTRPGTVWLTAQDVSSHHSNVEGLQSLEQDGLMGNWELDLPSGRGQWTAEVSQIHGMPIDCEPSPELSLSCFAAPVRARLEAAVARAVAEGEPYELELPMLTAAGEHRWIRTSGVPLYENGKVIKLLGLFKDVTPLVQARQELRREKDRFRTIFEAIPDLVWLKCPEGRFLECNDRFLSLLGASREDALGKTDYDFVERETADFFRAHDMRALQAPAPRRNEEWVTFPDGHQELLETIKRPFYEDGRLVGVLGIGRDLTDNYTVRQHLHESQERFRMFLEHTPAAVAMFDKSMRYLLVSHRYTRDFGIANRELLGRVHHELFPELPAQWREAHLRCLGGAVERCDEDSFVRADGSREWLRWEMRPWYQAGGGVGGVILFSEVLTSAKNAELALRQSEERNRAAQRMETVGRLAGGIAHDFNNLLTVIFSCTELAQMALHPDHPATRDLEEVMVAGKRAESLTRQLLTFSRTQITALGVVNWNDVVQGMSQILDRLIGEDVQLTLNSASGPCWVLADSSQLEQVLLNLAVNARDAMEFGGRLELTLESVAVESLQARALAVTPGAYARLTVRDEGSGMDEETRLRMFEPFFTTKGLGKGTGLGLSTVYAIVQQCGGSVEVESQRGRGTRIEVYLPLRSAPAGVESRPVDRSSQAPTGLGRLLVIEDEPPLRVILKRVLESAGYEVVLAAEAEEALATARREGDSFALVLSDIILPGMNGCELMEHLTPLCPNARQLFMSGYTDDVLDRFDIPRERIIPKPFDRHTITSQVHAALAAEPIGALTASALPSEPGRPARLL